MSDQDKLLQAADALDKRTLYELADDVRAIAAKVGKIERIEAIVQESDEVNDQTTDEMLVTEVRALNQIREILKPCQT